MRACTLCGLSGLHRHQVHMWTKIPRGLRSCGACGAFETKETQDTWCRLLLVLPAETNSERTER